MASNYGLNFGFRRSDETMGTREGRLKTPLAGTFRQGMWVSQDPAADGFLKAAAADAPGEPGVTGLLIQEEAHFNSVYGNDDAGFDSFSSRLGVAKNNTRSVIWTGPGLKVWFRNTAGSTRADGRIIAAVTMVDFTGLILGDYLKWDGTKYVEGTAANAGLKITKIDAANTYLEAVVLR